MQLEKIINRIYYNIKFLVPRRFQVRLKRILTLLKCSGHSAILAILGKAGKRPEKITGWPNNKTFALVLTHDADTAQGLQNRVEPMEMEKSLGFRFSCNCDAELYTNSAIKNRYENRYWYALPKDVAEF